VSVHVLAQCEKYRPAILKAQGILFDRVNVWLFAHSGGGKTGKRRVILRVDFLMVKLCLLILNCLAGFPVSAFLRFGGELFAIRFQFRALANSHAHVERVEIQLLQNVGVFKRVEGFDIAVNRFDLLFNFGEDHPTMDSPSTMIPPLTYIATREEMDSMMNAEKQKLALDAFWLKRTGSIERSKELIRIYYNRTLYANYYFSSYKPGWLTDRGMIYIMYGPPDKLYKNADGESWGYKKPKEKSRWGARFTVEDTYLWFNFAKKKSIFSDNNYTLNRALTPVSYWDVAVARWREGKVFSLDNPVELK